MASFRLGHISDLHVLELGGVPLAAFLNKRLAGGANLLLKRARSHKVEVAQQAFETLARQNVDHVVVTGDISNLALDPEFLRAKELLAGFGDGHGLSVIPGNHDCYTRSAAREGRFEKHFAEWLRSDRPQLAARGPYPWVRLREGVAIIGLSSAVPTPPLWATGTVSAAQIDALSRILALKAVRNRFRVVAVHHHFFPPPHKRFDRLRRLTNSRELLEVMLAGGVDLVLHGHNHRPAWAECPRPDGGLLRIVEAGSASAIHVEPEDYAAKINLYDIADGRLQRVTRLSYGLVDGTAERAFRVWQTIEP